MLAGLPIKLIIMTATMNMEFAEYFSACNELKTIIPIETGVEPYPVTTLYLEDLANEDVETEFEFNEYERLDIRRVVNRITAYSDAGEDAVQDNKRVFAEADHIMKGLLLSLILQIAEGDNGMGKCVLVFLPGLHRIWTIEQTLHKEGRGRIKVLKLHSQIPFEEEDNIKADASCCTVILSTTVAESSLTIDGLDYVIDTGLHKCVQLSSFSTCVICAAEVC
jgi:ATP-dependent RNA helicase DHX57